VGLGVVQVIFFQLRTLVGRITPNLLYYVSAFFPSSCFFFFVIVLACSSCVEIVTDVVFVWEWERDHYIEAVRQETSVQRMSN
jgi:hypothetical protein